MPKDTPDGSMTKGLADHRSENQVIRSRMFRILCIALALGSLFWGTTTLALGFGTASLIPFSYLVFTGLNLLACRTTGRVDTCMSLQVLLSLLLPFVFQSALGGMRPTGMVMFWSFVALTGALTFQRKRASIAWASVNLVLIGIWACFDPVLPGAPTLSNDPDTQQAFLAINLGACQVIIFVMAAVFVRKQGRIRRDMHHMRHELSTVNEELQARENSMRSSLRYAQVIQQALRPDQRSLAGIAHGIHVVDLPKEAVGGDLFWIGHKGELTFVAVLDCTGHGVPGSLLAMLVRGILGEVVQHPECDSASNLIRLTQRRLDEYLNRSISKSKDGVEMGVLCFDRTTNATSYAGVGISLIKVAGEQAYLYRGARPLTCQKLEWNELQEEALHISPGTRLCIFTDGVVDQLQQGGRRRLGTQGLRSLLSTITTADFPEMARSVETAMRDPQGMTCQVDDRLLVLLEPNDHWSSMAANVAA